ncbi:internal virion protein [Pseudomonas phage Henninger]|uniref:Protein inside capsid C n=1 Tax=Pseudomonas phage Henninger TaxID=2079287 RepID=A0A2K9VHD2_9CAUD|nr:internal virion protein [Pseudomonas phage Henninger]AUV61698.1 protein inside capsid C [Pseudomonas phage Henninger]
MANQIERAVDGAQMQQSGRLNSSVGTVGFQAAQQRAPVGSNGFAEAMQNFVKAGTNAYGAYKDEQLKTADARSNEIIRKLTPDQRREAISAGTLLYQDDPDAMNMLRYKTGRTAAYDVEDEINQKLSNGEFDGKDRDYLDKYRQQRLTDASKAYAESAGINESDPEYQRGYNEDIVHRSASIYDLHGQRRSKWFQSQAAVNTRGDLAPLLDDPEVMNTPSGGEHIANYFNHGIQSNQFPTDQSVMTSLTQLVNDAQNKPGGGNLIQSLRGQTINVLGGARKVEDLMGADVLDNAIVKSNENEYKKNADRTRSFSLGVTQAINQEDAATGWSMLQKLRGDNSWVQNGDEMTPQKSMLIEAEQHLMTRVKQDSAKRAESMKQGTQQDNRMDVLDKAYAARIAGQNVPVAPKDQAVDPTTTGEFKESDGPTFAARTMDRIDNSGLPDATKDQMRAQYLNADYEGGPFQTYYKTLITDAQREWGNSVRQGEAGDMPRLQELQRAFTTNEATIGAVFPEQADFLQQLKDLAEGGVTPQVLIDAQRSKKGTSPDEKKYRDEQWTALMNDSANKDLSSIPGPMQRLARTVYDGFVERTGNADQAKAKLTDWLNNNTVSFSEKDDESAYIGRLDKRTLMASPQDVNSWKDGQDIVKRTMQGLLETPQWAGASATVSSDANTGDILISSPTGRRVRLTKQSLQLIYKAQQEAAKTQAFDQGVNKAKAKQAAGQTYGGIM